MTTDILVVNAQMAAVVTSLVAICIPALMWLAFMLGHWQSQKWHEKHIEEYAEAVTREKYKDAVAHLAEEQREIDRLHEVIRTKDDRIRAITAAIRGAQVQAGNMAEVLTVCELEAM